MRLALAGALQSGHPLLANVEPTCLVPPRPRLKNWPPRPFLRDRSTSPHASWPTRAPPGHSCCCLPPRAPAPRLPPSSPSRNAPAPPLPLRPESPPDSFAAQATFARTKCPTFPRSTNLLTPYSPCEPSSTCHPSPPSPPGRSRAEALHFQVEGSQRDMGRCESFHPWR